MNRLGEVGSTRTPVVAVSTNVQVVNNCALIDQNGNLDF